MNIYGAYILGDLEVSGSIIGTASLAISSSYATTASFALNAGITINTSSFVTTSSFNSFTASYNTGSFTGSFTGSLLGTASFATTASFALSSPGGAAFPFTGAAAITGSLVVTGSFTVVTGSSIELQVTNTGVNIGNATTDAHTISGSTGVFGNISLTSASSFIDVTPVTGSTAGYKIGSSWVARFDTSRNMFTFGNNGTIYPSVTGIGGNNFFAGNNAIALGLTSGYNNIAIGFDNTNNEPLRNLTSGNANTALGRGALRGVTSGFANIGIGEFSGYSISTTGDNIALGYFALNKYTRTGTIAIGSYALELLVGSGAEDDYCVAIGYTAGNKVTNGRHVLIGYLAGRDMSGATSDFATMVGTAAGYGLRTSNNDTALGSLAMGWFNSLGTTTSNVAVGYGAMQLASSSRYMVAVGYEAGYQNGTATGTGTNDGSVYIGYTAGRLTLGNYNVFIGYGAGSTITAASNTFILANSSTALLMTGSFTTKRVDFFGSVNAPSFTGSIQATGSLNFNGSELSTAWTSYTPAWTAASSDPALNNGTITGAYKVIGKTCFVRGRLVMGSTTTFGTGAWYFQLPFTASTPYGIQIPASFLDNGTNWYSGLMNGGRLGSSTKSEIQWQNTSSVAVGLESTVPFTWGNLDEISWNGSYEIT